MFLVADASMRQTRQTAVLPARAAAVGALTGLQSLELVQLRRFLCWREICHSHLQGLSGLSYLKLSYLAPGDAAGGDGAGFASMLSGMTQLQALILPDQHCATRHLHRVGVRLTAAQLVELNTLVRRDVFQRSTFLASWWF